MGMTDIMLNIPRKVVHEYSTPMMFCTVPTDPPAVQPAVVTIKYQTTAGGGQTQNGTLGRVNVMQVSKCSGLKREQARST